MDFVKEKKKSTIQNINDKYFVFTRWKKNKES